MADPTLTLKELQLRGEGADLEVKKAGGRDGRGEVPPSLWETYSAMANTDGGVIYLGIREKPPGVFSVTGIEAVDKVRKALWDHLNNRQTISHNLLREEDVGVEEIAGRRVIRIRVPRASRHQRPVHVDKNPLEGTFIRRYEGDYRCSAEEVRRMLAEQVEEGRDARLLDGFTLDDLDAESLRAYRQMLKLEKPDHRLNTLDDTAFLRHIGGWRRDRRSGTEGLTLAGLLMFGRQHAILEVLPNYFLDY